MYQRVTPTSLCLFFSRRRRHTRSYGDWSSDVCSSDLRVGPAVDAEQFGPAAGGAVDAEQQPDRGRLPGPVRAQVAVHLAGLDRQVEGIERQRLAVALGQALGPYRLHRAGPVIWRLLISLAFLHPVAPPGGAAPPPVP